MYPPRKDDIDAQELCNLVGPLIDHGDKVYIKWTCPACGERVTATDQLQTIKGYDSKPAVLLHQYYRHDEKANGAPCGESVTAQTGRFGILVVSTLDGAMRIINH